MRLKVQYLALLSGLGIQRCRKLWCRLQMWLGSLRCCGSGGGWRLQLLLDPWPGSLHVPWERPKRWQKDKKEKEKKKKKFRKHSCTGVCVVIRFLSLSKVAVGGIAGLSSKCMFTFIKGRQIVFQSICTTLHFYQ